ncbi:MAG: peptidylprolyl isomerase [Roseobacter sp.]
MNLVTKFCQTAFLSATLAFGTPIAAQGLFDPVVFVNDDVITAFEVEQRQQFLELLNAPGASRDSVIDTLIDERLRAQEIDRAGLELTEEALQTGLEEFAARANLSAEEFTAALAEGGVAFETFEDFVAVGVAWRDYIASRFGPSLQVSEADIDQALGRANTATSIRVLISEIIIPAPEDRREEVDLIADEIAALTSAAEFSEYAREFSATATRDQGGRLEWQALNNLPPVLRPLLLGLGPNEVTEPINIPNAVALFQLRGIEETGAPAAEYAAIDYAAYYIPGGRSAAALAEAAKVRQQVDVCDDLYGIAQGQPVETLERGAKIPAEIPTDIAVELSKLDPGETSIALTRSNGETLVFLMLCGRTATAFEEADRTDVANSLRSNRLNAIADSYVEQLRADSRIIQP